MSVGAASNSPKSWLTASVARLRSGQTDGAIDACRQGLALAPGHPLLMVQMVRCLTVAGRRSEAERAARAAEAAVGGSPVAQHELGNAWTVLDQHARALPLMRAASRHLPDDPALNYNLATVLRFLGQFEEAEDRLDRVIAVNPDDFEAYNLRSQLRTQAPDRNHLAQLEERLSRPCGGWSGEVKLRYALSKEYEDLGRHAEAFEQLRLGAALRRRHLDYDVSGDVTAMDDIRAVFDAAWFTSPGVGATTDAPIFVCGLPRSGTTLVDRILSSHPDVCSLGELNAMPQAVVALGAGGPRPNRRDLMERVAATNPRILAEGYLRRVGDRPDGALRFIDKLPMNYLYLELIARALPEATLVLVERTPMAAGLAMFKTLFNQGYPFSYDLDDLGRYIVAYRRLIDHWRDLLGERLCIVSYEALVLEQEPVIRRLVARCGLNWNDACLAPEKNPAPSSTQSAVQVRRPIYTESVEQWRLYEAQLAPLNRWIGQDTDSVTAGVLFGFREDQDDEVRLIAMP